MRPLRYVVGEPQPGMAKRLPGDRPVRRVAIHAVAILGTGAVAGALLALGVESPVRVALALAFLLFGPGLALGELLEVRDLDQRLALGAGFSLAVDTVVGLALVYAGAYSTGLAFALVFALSTVLLAIAFLRVGGADSGGGSNPI